ncbi:OxaA: inner membrane protein [Desulfosarcina variabilis str. Montpellier]|uniref:membrane protein insertase YidC n=1 Tax=Desulfosarcina variabilis TaxID=2300 RepID=UPI003AFA70D2
MEQARLLLAIGLSFLVLFVWSMFFTDQQPVNNQDPEKPQAQVVETPTPDQPAQQAATTISQSDLDEIQNEAVPENPAREITIETPYYVSRISAKGAAFTSFILKKYRESVNVDSPNKELIQPDFKNGIIRTTLLDKSVHGLENAVFSIDQTGDNLSVSGEKKEIAFKWVAADGTIIIKTYTFDPGSYLIGLKVAIQNASQNAINDQLVLSLRKPVEKEKGYGFVGPSALINDSLEQIKPKNIEDKDRYEGKIKWIGIEDRYFISSIIPAEEFEGSIKLGLNDKIVSNQLINPTFELSPGKQIESQFYIFMGPKSMELLNSLGHDLGKALNFGFFDIIAKPCLWFMNQIHSVIPNYGIAIILLTIFTKILLWPLGNKSYKSMSEMKKLQPLMAEIREKHKDDKQKMNQELMALYRTYKVNPVGGCLPMVLQIPVFFALYRMLYQAIELRHAPFFLWINDLSAPDRLFDFGFSIPFMEPPYGIPVLTIIMGATMLLQQKMSPPPGDPTQAKMMMLMPVVFTFIFINFSSGLVLYWLVNNILSISQQYYVQKKTI